MAVYALGDLEPSISPTAWVHPEATVIGDVVIGDESSVWPRAVLRGDHGAIRLGGRTDVRDGAVLHATASLDTVVGDDVVLGHLAHLEGCTVEDGVLTRVRLDRAPPGGDRRRRHRGRGGDGARRDADPARPHGPRRGGRGAVREERGPLPGRAPHDRPSR